LIITLHLHHLKKTSNKWCITCLLFKPCISSKCQEDKMYISIITLIACSVITVLQRKSYES
jgi:hypothetical protein